MPNRRVFCPPDGAIFPCNPPGFLRKNCLPAAQNPSLPDTSPIFKQALGIATANKMADKFARTGLHAVKSQRVDAPVITEYPVTLKCEVAEMQNQPYGLRVLGRIVNVLADEKVLDEAGKIDAGKLQTFAFDQMRNGYYAVGEKVGQAWHSGADLMKKQ